MAEKKKKAPEETGQAEPKGGKEAPAEAGGLPEDLIETVLEEDDPPAPSKDK